ncbi:tail protein [Shewanella phage vB_SspS_KASIA]|nr:tail protein [Shewanella phage vB_SspS_KASIA]
MSFNIKPTRMLGQAVKEPPPEYLVSLYKTAGSTITYGSESNSHFIDVISLGPTGGIIDAYLDETPISSGEFPKSTIFFHDGSGAEKPWVGDFPFVERTISLGKNAEITEVGETNYSVTTFQRKVSSVGVEGIRVNFTSAGITHKDDKGREKTARSKFKVEAIDPNGIVIAVSDGQYKEFASKNPVAVQVYLQAPEGFKNTIWEYRVTMEVMGFNYSTSLSGNWSASTVTELYMDTQTYDNISYSSGTIVASDVSGKIPKRQYLLAGYKVLVPEYQDIGGTQVLTGTFTRAVSDSPAWNAMAVITDTLWGAGQPLDKVDIVSFDEFSKYCKQLVGGDQRYSFSQYLIKSDNYYKLASEMVGSADGRLYEDNSGRIGVLIDKQTSNRRVVTSYDIVDEMVKRTTVAEEKKINYVEAEFEDRDNQYKKTIIKIEDENAITKNGVISKNLKLDTCTKLSEAQRTIKKMLVTSQVATSSYVLKVGHTHEDVQIGEVLEVYDRKFANVNYCGKIAAGSTLNVIQIDARTPINLTGIKQPLFTIDTNRGVPIKIAINSWASNSITLATNLPSIPAEFTSFGVDDADATGIKPTLIRVLGVDDSSGVLSLEGVEYNDSLYSHVENGTPLVVHKYKYIPAQTTVEITGLQLVRTLTGITASWDSSGAGYGYGYNWKFTPVGGTTIYIGSGVTDNLQVSLLKPLGEGTYEIQVLATLNGESVGEYAIDTLYVGVDTGSTLPAPTGLASLLPDGTFSTDFVGRSFTIRWDQVEEVAGVTVSHFKLRVIQGATTYEVIVDKSSRQYRFSEEVLTSQFGSYTRYFTIQLVTVDSELKTAELRQIAIANPVPPLPVVTVNNTGSLTLSYGATLPTDLTGTLLRIWEGTSQFEPIPVDAVSLLSSETLEISLPDDVVKQDGTSYVFDAVWVDSFGSDGTNHGRVVFAFDPNAQIPVSPELYEAVPIDSQTVMVKYTHSGLYLKRIQVSYRRYGTTTWTTLAEVFTVPPVDSDSGYDIITGEGYVKVSGLVRNINYEFKLNVANTVGLYSEDSNYITGTPFLDVLKPSDIPNLDDIILGAELTDPRMLIVEGVSDVFGEGKNSAEIITVKKVVADEKQAQATAITRIEAKVGENTATILETQDALATETLARVVAISELTVKVGANTAGIVNAQQAIVDETNARVSSIQQLTVQVGEDIALVDQSAKAAIGYCSIGGSFSSHETKDLCQAAGGTWTNSTLATSVRTVQVSSGGSTATVGDFYSAYVDLEGNVVGKAVLGVDINGAFTGMEVVGGSTYSQLIFKGNTIKFQSTAGVDQLVYENTTNTWSFKGTIYAENIEGDVTDVDVMLTTGYTWGVGVSSTVNILKFKVNALPFFRKVRVDPIVIQPLSSATNIMSAELRYSATGVGDPLTWPVIDIVLFNQGGSRPTSQPLYGDTYLGVDGYFAVSLHRTQTSGSDSAQHDAQDLAISVFKSGSTLTQL